MTTDVLALAWAVLQGTDRKGVAQRVKPRRGLTRAAMKAELADEPAKDRTHASIGEPLAVEIDEEEVLLAADGESATEVALEPVDGGLVQGKEAALAELGLSDNETIGRQVVKTQGQGLADAHAGAQLPLIEELNGEQDEDPALRVGMTYDF